MLFRSVPPSPDPDSPFYLGEDTWLVDYPPRIRLWERYADRVTVIDYDEQMRLHSSVLPSFAGILGIAPSRDYFLNRSSDVDEILRQKIAALGDQERATGTHGGMG